MPNSKLTPLQPLEPKPALNGRTAERSVEAITNDALAPGPRIRREELGPMLGVSRQPISHTLQLLRRRKFVEEDGRRGLTAPRSTQREFARFTGSVPYSIGWRPDWLPSGLR
jgi:DNA-binding GntR family transcriptional regulator